MKIAILTSEYITEANWHGGLANYLHRIVEGLADEGHDIHIFVYSDKKEIFKNRKALIHRIAFNEKYLWAFNLFTFRLIPGFARMLYAAFKFRRYFLKINQTEKFDIVHSASCQTPALFLDEKKIGAPLVTRLSSVMKLCQIAYARKNKIDMFLVNQAEKSLIRKSSQVFAPSYLVKKKVLEQFGCEIDVLESPAYFENYGKAAPSVYEKYLSRKKYLLFYGTLGRLKGSEFIAENIYKILDIYRDIHFVFVGKMEALRKRLLPIEPIIKNAREHRKRIFYTNSLPHPQLLPIIMNARAIILPSMIDNLPNTCIESMSLGKIVIGTKEGGFDQLITNKHSGFVVNYGDNQALMKAIDFVLNADKIEFSKMEINARQAVRRRLDFASKINELEEYYKKAIDEYNGKYDQRNQR